MPSRRREDKIYHKVVKKRETSKLRNVEKKKNKETMISEKEKEKRCYFEKEKQNLY